MKTRDWLNGEPFALSLSAGFFGFYAHCGFTKALFELGHQPCRIMGSSAGALMGSLICAGYTFEEIEKIILKIKKEDFWDLSLGLGLLKGEKFKSLLEDYLPRDFSDLKIPLSVSVHPLLGLKGKSISEGSLIPAVMASCCFPGLFHPVKIQDRLFVDGGVSDWLGSQSTPRDEKVLFHFLKPTGFHSLYVYHQVFKKMQPHKHHYVLLPDLKEMGPNRMHMGFEAVEEAYRKSLKQFSF